MLVSESIYMEILDGKKVADSQAETLKEAFAALDFTPKLVIFRVGERADSKSYVERKVAMAERLGVQAEVVHMPSSVSESELLVSIEAHNQASDTHGMIVQLPLPEGVNSDRIINAIDSRKDVDGLTDHNIAKLAANEPGVVPATPRGILSLLKDYDVPVAGKHVVVIGRSRLVGKSVSLLLQNHDATVTMCHSKTTDLAAHTSMADIVIVATGQQRFISSKHLRDGQTVIDVGIGADANERIVGDVDVESVQDLDIKLSPVPGGVGPMTVISLFENLLTVVKEFQKN